MESKQKGKVRNFTNFGLFVELEEGIDGLVHISDLSWSKKIKHPSSSATWATKSKSSCSNWTRKTAA